MIMPTVSSLASFARFELQKTLTPATLSTYRSLSTFACFVPSGPMAPIDPSEVENESVIGEPPRMRITCVSDSQRKKPSIGPAGAALLTVPAVIADAAVLLPPLRRDLPAARMPDVSTLAAPPNLYLVKD